MIESLTGESLAQDKTGLLFLGLFALVAFAFNLKTTLMKLFNLIKNWNKPPLAKFQEPNKK